MHDLLRMKENETWPNIHCTYAMAQVKTKIACFLKYEQVGLTSVSSTCMLLKNDTLGLLCLNTDCFDI